MEKPPSVAPSEKSSAIIGVRRRFSPYGFSNNATNFT